MLEYGYLLLFVDFFPYEQHVRSLRKFQNQQVTLIRHLIELRLHCLQQHPLLYQHLLLTY